MNQGAKTGCRARKSATSRRRDTSYIHGECGTASFSFIRTVTVGPGFTPGLLTLSTRRGARGLPGQSRITAGGDFHPALRTSSKTIKEFQADVNRFPAKISPFSFTSREALRQAVLSPSKVPDPPCSRIKKRVLLSSMHEMSIVESILGILREEMVKYEGQKLTKVTIRNGQLAGVVTEALQFAWDALIPGGEFDGAELEIIEIPLKVACGECGEVFSPEHSRCMSCPKCEALLGHDVLEGKEMQIASIEVDDLK